MTEGMIKFMHDSIDSCDYYNQEAKKEMKSWYYDDNQPNVKCLKLNDQIIGAVALDDCGSLVATLPSSFTVWIEWLAVSKEYRNKDVAKILIREVEKYAKEIGSKSVSADVRVNNEAIIEVLTRIGYDRIFVHEDYWMGQDYEIWRKDI